MLSTIRLLRFQKTITKRNFCVKKSSDYEEIHIPVPWGHIKGKWWGPKDKRPILAIHGWQDNCGSFDRLVPMLSSDISFLAVDVPGHGKSSWITPGFIYDYYDFVVAIRTIVKYYKWPKVSFLGHSAGNTMAILYCSAYPQEVDMLVGIDMMKTIDAVPEDCMQLLKIKLDHLLKLNNFKEPASYTLDEIKTRILEAYQGSICEKTAPYLIERSVIESKKHPGKYIISRDPRLKPGIMYTLSCSEIVTLAKEMNFPILNIQVKNSGFYKNSAMYDQYINELKKHNKHVTIIKVDSTHHVHLVHPEKICKDINSFILNHRKDFLN